MAYGPFWWCRWQRVDPQSLGLVWTYDRRSIAECLALTTVVLAGLTVVAMNWPGETLPRASSLNRTFNMLLSGTAAAIIEEIFWRGWVQPLLKRWMPALLAVVIAAALFGASHLILSPKWLSFATFLPGILMGLLKERHNSLATPTLFHFLGNVWAIWFYPTPMF